MPVYIIRAGDTEMVKIGWTNRTVEERRDDIQTSNHEPLHIIRALDWPRAAERWLHAHFNALHVRNEWFRFAPDMLTVELDTIRHSKLRMPEAMRQRLSEIMRKSWKDGNSRRTFDMSRQSAAP